MHWDSLATRAGATKLILKVFQVWSCFVNQDAATKPGLKSPGVQNKTWFMRMCNIYQQDFFYNHGKNSVAKAAASKAKTKKDEKSTGKKTSSVSKSTDKASGKKAVEKDTPTDKASGKNANEKAKAKPQPLDLSKVEIPNFMKRLGSKTHPSDSGPAPKKRR